MAGLLTPSRQRGIEHLDAPDVDPGVRRRSHRDIQLSNVLFGAIRALLAEFERVLPALPKEATLLDVGTGVGDIPARATKAARRHGVELTAVGLDCVPELVATSTHRIPMGVCANALELPFADHCIDVVCCSQVLHHFEEPEAITMLREMHRVARHYVIVSDLRRSWLAVAGLWGVSFPLGFHPVSRHDGVVSILRGFTTGELRTMVRRAVGAEADVRSRIGFRVTATWARDKS
ncbi:MAG: methyltransferase domain-containing protein [Gemmatimonadaceae bacterium]